jgi:hypothetical protein
MNCTRCDGTGFLNLHQVDDETLDLFEATGEHEVIFKWMDAYQGHDVGVCDCCGDGTDWYGKPGEHCLDNNEPFPRCA